MWGARWVLGVCLCGIGWGRFQHPHIMVQQDWVWGVRWVLGMSVWNWVDVISTAIHSGSGETGWEAHAE